MIKLSQFYERYEKRKEPEKQKSFKIGESWLRAILQLIPVCGSSIEKVLFANLDAERQQIIDDMLADLLEDNIGNQSVINQVKMVVNKLKLLADRSDIITEEIKNDLFSLEIKNDERFNALNERIRIIEESIKEKKENYLLHFENYQSDLQKRKSPSFTREIKIDTWVGRNKELTTILRWYSDLNIKVGAVIGIGGSGKTTLIRKVCDEIENSINVPYGIFFWSFYERQSFDEFIEGLLYYIYMDTSILAELKSTSNRIDWIIDKLNNIQHLIILDGVELLQKGGQHNPKAKMRAEDVGYFNTPNIKMFLERFLSNVTNSFCLVTSRLPLVNLREHIGFISLDINENLTLNQSCQLLIKQGLNGADDSLKKTAKDICYYFPLAITIISDIVKDMFNSNLDEFIGIDFPSIIIGINDKKKWEKAAKALKLYSALSNHNDIFLLNIVATFKYPIPAKSLEELFQLASNESQDKIGVFDIRSSLSKLNNSGMVIKEIREDFYSGGQPNTCYTAHPIVKSYFYEVFQDKEKEILLNYAINNFLDVSKPTKLYSIKQLEPFIELCHLTCLTKNFDKSWEYYVKYISDGDRYQHMYELGAYETTLKLLEEFFIDSDIYKDVLLKLSNAKREILNTVGLCLMYQGQLKDAVYFITEKINIALNSEDYTNASQGSILLSGLYNFLGELENCNSAGKKAHKYAVKSNNKNYIRSSIARLAWSNHLLGKLDIASKQFSEAELLTREISPKIPFLYSTAGINHSDHLTILNKLSLAKTITEKNLEISLKNHWLEDIALSYRALGDLKRMQGNLTSAKKELEESLRISRNISRRDVLISSLLSIGKFNIINNEVDLAYLDLNEALRLSIEGDYIIYEINIRFVISYLLLKNKKNKDVQIEYEKALELSKRINYRWEILSDKDFFISQSVI